MKAASSLGCTIPVTIVRQRPYSRPDHNPHACIDLASRCEGRSPFSQRLLCCPPTSASETLQTQHVSSHRHYTCRLYRLHLPERRLASHSNMESTASQDALDNSEQSCAERSRQKYALAFLRRPTGRACTMRLQGGEKKVFLNDPYFLTLSRGHPFAGGVGKPKTPRASSFIGKDAPIVGVARRGIPPTPRACTDCQRPSVKGPSFPAKTLGACNQTGKSRARLTAHGRGHRVPRCPGPSPRRSAAGPSLMK